MGKISPVSAKYIIHARIHINGVVDRPDVIGAIFGQTEGLLGADLELRELQRSGRIGRIEVKTETKAGKTEGTITIPSSLDKTETAVVAAALETIERIGPCNAKVRVEKIEDVRVLKRNYVISRAKELLKIMTEEILPDSQELTEKVEHSVRMMGITEYGKERLPAGPNINEAEELIVVEGRADVLNLLKHGFKNVIALNGTSTPETIKELSKEKVITLFVDGDRGGDLIIKEVSETADVDFVCKAPDGKEVEELTKKEIHKALRNKIAIEQARLEIKDVVKETPKKFVPQKKFQPKQRRQIQKPQLPQNFREKFKQLLDDLIGTRGAYILDEKLNILGKVPTIELVSTIKSLGPGIFAIIFDGSINDELVNTAEKANIKYLVAMNIATKNLHHRIALLTPKDLE